LALVLNKQAWVPLAVTGGQETVALRVPNHPVALRLLQVFGGGIAAPSANRFCRISPTQASHVAEELGDSVDLILDGGACHVGVESTIVDLTGDHPRLLRPGQISETEIAAVLGMELLLPDSGSLDTRAPGMMAVHYAPMTATMLCRAEDLATQLAALMETKQRIGLLAYHPKPAFARQIQIIQMPDSAEAYAQVLYASLRQLDAMQLDQIIVEQPPVGSAWRAINDRLAKAAGRA
jgi:L-threonylcarbamoyladenylate synthase